MRRAILYTLLAAIIWGTTFPAVDYGLSHLGLEPFGFAFLRFATGALAMCLYSMARGMFDARIFSDPWIWGVAVLNTGGYVFQFIAQDATTASKTGLLVNLNVIVVAGLGWWILRERPSRTLALALPLALMGVVLLTTDGDLSRVAWREGEFRGDVLALLAGLVWSFHFVATKAYLLRPRVDAIRMATGVLVLTAFFLWPLAWAYEGVPRVASWQGWAVVLYLGLAATALAFVLWQTALLSEPATHTALLLLVEIVIALAVSVAFLGERMGPAAAWGALAVIAAAWLANRAPRPQAATASPL